MGAECLCLCIPAQSFYVPVVPSGIIYNSRQFYNGHSVLFILITGAAKARLGIPTFPESLSFLLSAVVLLASLPF